MGYPDKIRPSTLTSTRFSMGLSFKSILISTNGDSEVRRFSISIDGGSSFTNLRQKLLIVYPHLQNCSSFRVSWKDADDDMVTICSEEEFMIFLSEQKSEPYKIYVTHEKANTNGGTNGMIHPGITCDGCNGSVAGFRYKCLFCYDFDLCSSCENRGMHPEHYFIRISTPTNMPGKFAHKMGKKFEKMARRGNCNRQWRQGAAGEGTRPEGSRPECSFFRRDLNDILSMLATFGIVEPPSADNNGGSGEGPSTSANNNPQQSPPTGQRPMDEIVSAFCYLQSLAAKYLDPTGFAGNESCSNNDQGSSVQMETEEPSAAAPEANHSAENNTFTPSAPQSQPQKESTSSNQTAETKRDSVPQQKEFQAQQPLTTSYPLAVPVMPIRAEQITEQRTSPVAGPSGRSSSPGASGWTMLPPPQDLSNRETDNPKTQPQPTSILYPQLPQQQSSPSGKVQESLDRMLRMGFNNEGEWLRQMLEENGGDIGQVLDILLPIRAFKK